MTARTLLLALALPVLTATTVLTAPGVALAGDLKGVVELFTSQGWQDWLNRTVCWR